MKKLIVLLVLLIFVFGCTIPPTPKDTFKLGETFTIRESQTFSEEKNKFIVKAVSFSDSRCPADRDIVCACEGELGVNLEIGQPGENFEIYLGTVTKPKETFSSYEIELISIDFEKKKT